MIRGNCIRDWSWNYRGCWHQPDLYNSQMEPFFARGFEWFRIIVKQRNRQRDRERERERQTERETERQRQTEIETGRETETGRERETQYCCGNGTRLVGLFVLVLLLLLLFLLILFVVVILLCSD
jgi:Flp pilus assembly protein TadB